MKAVSLRQHEVDNKAIINSRRGYRLTGNCDIAYHKERVRWL